MARLPRLAIDGQLHSLLHRAKPGRAAFVDPADWADYRAALLVTSRDAQVAIHAYALLPDRVHLLLTPAKGSGLAEMMQRLGRRYAGAYNGRHAGHGGLWDGRYRVTVLEAATYLFDAIRHVETAPVFAGQIDEPQHWPASSAAHHLGLCIDPLISEHPLYWSSGNTPFEREAAHRARLDPRQAGRLRSEAIERATMSAWALGSPAFVEGLAAQQARRLLPLARGRPSKSKAPEERVTDLNSDPN